MQTTRSQGRSLALPVVRWGARILSAAILLFWGWFLIAHLLSEEGLFSRAPAPVLADYIGLTAMGIALLGLALAWKWELLGGLMAILAYVILAVVNLGGLGGPFILWPITAVLFLSSWWMHRTAQRGTAAMRPTG